MNIDNRMFVHRVKSVTVETEDLVTDSGDPFTVTRYKFLDAEGNTFTVNAILDKGEEE